MIKQIAYTHGRFQPVHYGHFDVFTYILKHYDTLWIGIANPLRELPKDLDKLDPKLKESILKARAPENNPYTYIEREEMIRAALENVNVDMRRIRVLPHFSFYDFESWRDFMPPKGDSVIVLPAKDTHHYSKLDVYKREGWEVELLPQIGRVSGKVFDAAWPDGNWKDLVPKGVDKILEKILNRKL